MFNIRVASWWPMDDQPKKSINNKTAKQVFDLFLPPVLSRPIEGELHGDLLWACAWPAQPQEQGEPACPGAPPDGALRGGPVQAGRHLLQRRPGPDGVWQQGQVTEDQETPPPF